MRILQFLNDWIDQKLSGTSSKVLNPSELSIRFPDSSCKRIQAVVDKSAHDSIHEIIIEALRVSETIYEYSSKGHTVHCEILNGKIVMTIDGPDDDGGLPVEEDDVVIHLFPKAA